MVVSSPIDSQSNLTNCELVEIIFGDLFHSSFQFSDKIKYKGIPKVRKSNNASSEQILKEIRTKLHLGEFSKAKTLEALLFYIRSTKRDPFFKMFFK